MSPAVLHSAWWEPEGVSGSAGEPSATPGRYVTGSATPTWGLGDVAGGVLAAQVLSIVVLGIVFGATGWSTAAEAPIWATALLQVPLWAGLAGAVVYAGRLKGNGLVADFGLCSKLLDAPLGLAVGIGTQLVVLPLLYWPVLSLLGRSTEELSEPARELASRADGTFGWIVLAVMVVAIAPVVEELFYRGLVMRALTKRGWSPWVAIVGSAALFGGMHFQPLQFLGLFVLGVLLGVLAHRSGRLGPAIWAHVGFNATTVVSLYVHQAN